MVAVKRQRDNLIFRHIVGIQVHQNLNRRQAMSIHFVDQDMPIGVEIQQSLFEIEKSTGVRAAHVVLQVSIRTTRMNNSSACTLSPNIEFAISISISTNVQNDCAILNKQTVPYVVRVHKSSRLRFPTEVLQSDPLLLALQPRHLWCAGWGR